MFKKQSQPLDALTSRRRAVVKPRLHRFPPLRKGWNQRGVNAEAVPEGTFSDPAEVQQQCAQGFQEGLNSGFAQGLEEGKEEGYQEGARLGFDDGMRKGLAEGKQQARQQFLQAAEPFDRLVAQMQQALAGYEQRRREELLRLVEKVSSQVIRCELSLHPTQLLALVEEASASLPQPAGPLRVRVNPEEYRHISEAEPEKVQQWRLSPDPALAPGECRIITDSSEMDVGCQHRLEQCMTVLKENLLPESHDE